MKAGAAAADVSPDRIAKGRLWMSGYMPARSAEEVESPIEVRALAVGDASGGLLFVTIDTCLLSPMLAGRWRKMISRKVPLPPERIFIIATHTHSGPDLTVVFGGIPVDYFLKIRSGVLRACVTAWERRESCALYAGSGLHSMGLARRRRLGQKTYDREFTTLQWRNAQGAVATMINLACHGVVLPKSSRLLSSDLPGALCRNIDAGSGGVTLFAPRDQGDVNPDMPADDTYEQDGTVEDIYRLADAGADDISSSLDSAGRIESSAITAHEKKCGVRIRKLTGAVLKFPLWSGRPGGVPGRLDVPYHRLGIGGIEGMTFPGEVLSCLGAGIMERMSKPALLITYCNGWYGYFMTRETFARGGYEPSMSPGPLDIDDMDI